MANGCSRLAVAGPDRGADESVLSRERRKTDTLLHDRAIASPRQQLTEFRRSRSSRLGEGTFGRGWMRGSRQRSSQGRELLRIPSLCFRELSSIAQHSDGARRQAPALDPVLQLTEPADEPDQEFAESAVPNRRDSDRARNSGIAKRRLLASCRL